MMMLRPVWIVSNPLKGASKGRVLGAQPLNFRDEREEVVAGEDECLDSIVGDANHITGIGEHPLITQTDTDQTWPIPFQGSR